MAARIRPMPGQLWRPTREGSQAAPRLIVTVGSEWREPDVRFRYHWPNMLSDVSTISLTGWFAWVRMHAAVGELHTGDP